MAMACRLMGRALPLLLLLALLALHMRSAQAFCCNDEPHNGFSTRDCCKDRNWDDSGFTVPSQYTDVDFDYVCDTGYMNDNKVVWKVSNGNPFSVPFKLSSGSNVYTGVVGASTTIYVQFPRATSDSSTSCSPWSRLFGRSRSQAPQSVACPVSARPGCQGELALFNPNPFTLFLEYSVYSSSALSTALRTKQRELPPCRTVAGYWTVCDEEVAVTAGEGARWVRVRQDTRNAHTYSCTVYTTPSPLGDTCPTANKLVFNNAANLTTGSTCAASPVDAGCATGPLGCRTVVDHLGGHTARSVCVPTSASSIGDLLGVDRYSVRSTSANTGDANFASAFRAQQVAVSYSPRTCAAFTLDTAPCSLALASHDDEEDDSVEMQTNSPPPTPRGNAKCSNYPAVSGELWGKDYFLYGDVRFSTKPTPLNGVVQSVFTFHGESSASQPVFSIILSFAGVHTDTVVTNIKTWRPDGTVADYTVNYQKAGFDWSAAEHVYTIRWRADQVQWLVDNTVMRTETTAARIPHVAGRVAAHSWAMAAQGASANSFMTFAGIYNAATAPAHTFTICCPHFSRDGADTCPAPSSHKRSLAQPRPQVPEFVIHPLGQAQAAAPVVQDDGLPSDDVDDIDDALFCLQSAGERCAYAYAPGGAASGQCAGTLGFNITHPACDQDEQGELLTAGQITLEAIRSGIDDGGGVCGATCEDGYVWTLVNPEGADTVLCNDFLDCSGGDTPSNGPSFSRCTAQFDEGTYQVQFQFVKADTGAVVTLRTCFYVAPAPVQEENLALINSQPEQRFAGMAYLYALEGSTTRPPPLQLAYPSDGNFLFPLVVCVRRSQPDQPYPKEFTLLVNILDDADANKYINEFAHRTDLQGSPDTCFAVTLNLTSGFAGLNPCATPRRTYTVLVKAEDAAPSEFDFQFRCDSFACSAGNFSSALAGVSTALTYTKSDVCPLTNPPSPGCLAQCCVSYDARCPVSVKNGAYGTNITWAETFNAQAALLNGASSAPDSHAFYTPGWTSGNCPSISGNNILWSFDPPGSGLFVVNATTGTARLTGRLVNNANPAYLLDLNISFTGYSNTSSEAPKKELSASSYVPSGPINIATWVYYTGVSGTATGVPGTALNGVSVSIARRGPPFQVGEGANGKNYFYGGSTWITVERLSAGTGTCKWTSSSISGDVNLNILPHCKLCVTATPPPTDCESNPAACPGDDDDDDDDDEQYPICPPLVPGPSTVPTSPCALNGNSLQSGAARVTSQRQGPLAKGTKSPANKRSNPQAVLTLEDRRNEADFFSLGFGGEIIVEFSPPAAETLSVYETTWTPDKRSYPENADVYALPYGVELATATPTQWVKIGSVATSTTTDRHDTVRYDLPLGAGRCFRYIRIVDTTNANFYLDRNMKEADGFDVNYVSATRSCTCASRSGSGTSPTTIDTGSGNTNGSATSTNSTEPAPVVIFNGDQRSLTFRARAPYFPDARLVLFLTNDTTSAKTQLAAGHTVGCYGSFLDAHHFVTGGSASSTTVPCALNSPSFPNYQPDSVWWFSATDTCAIEAVLTVPFDALLSCPYLAKEYSADTAQVIFSGYFVAALVTADNNVRVYKTVFFRFGIQLLYTQTLTTPLQTQAADTLSALGLSIGLRTEAPAGFNSALTITLSTDSLRVQNIAYAGASDAAAASDDGDSDGEAAASDPSLPLEKVSGSSGSGQYVFAGTGGQGTTGEYGRYYTFEVTTTDSSKVHLVTVAVQLDAQPGEGIVVQAATTQNNSSPAHAAAPLPMLLLCTLLLAALLASALAM